ncbi:hypothetical protein [Clostridium disporicum]|uniref:DUF3108 domain-containing protein n=1 Tax=Clostridium disporicum TaxID=84024 RepID=UPI0006C468A1|nr:hypothetical protein [Clostridium disporicum]CUO52131.1 Uncharacterised protein [Clostridium disporicum]
MCYRCFLYKLKNIKSDGDIDEIGEVKIISEIKGENCILKYVKVINGIEVENSYVLFNNDTFIPIESRSEYKVNSVSIDIVANFSKKNVLLKGADSLGNNKKKKIKIKYDTIDIIQLYKIIEILYKKEENKISINILNNLLGDISELIVENCGKEIVNINDTEYRAIRISVSDKNSNEKQFLLFSDDCNNILLKIFSGNTYMEYIG